jgi:hypothetical protein
MQWYQRTTSGSTILERGKVTGNSSLRARSRRYRDPYAYRSAVLAATKTTVLMLVPGNAGIAAQYMSWIVCPGLCAGFALVSATVKNSVIHRTAVKMDGKRAIALNVDKPHSLRKGSIAMPVLVCPCFPAPGDFLFC